MKNDDPNDRVLVPLNGELDLHTFRPKEVASVVAEYIRACHQEGVYSLRLIHGKGVGNLRRTVHSVLEKHSLVESYGLADAGAGGWGATLAELKKGRSGNGS